MLISLAGLDNTSVSTHLGKTSKYECLYNPALLVREPRQSNRAHLNIDDDNLPFVGYDIWNAYEVSALLTNGQPVTFVAKIVYPCNSKFIVESKSLKLYFNSYNMTKVGEVYSDAAEHISATSSKESSSMSCAFLIRRGSAVMTPSTSFQSQIASV